MAFGDKLADATLKDLIENGIPALRTMLKDVLATGADDAHGILDRVNGTRITVTAEFEIVVPPRTDKPLP